MVEQIVREYSGRQILVTFGIPVPARHGPADLFDFLRQQGYLRVWLERQSDAHRRAGQIRPAPGDRSGHSGSSGDLESENRSRLVEAIEAGLPIWLPARCQIVSQESHASIFHRLALPALRSRHPGAQSGTLQLQ